MTGIQWLVIAKAPVVGQVKTRLCPPCTPAQATWIAAAALADTLSVVTAAPAVRRTLVLSGRYAPPPGWHIAPQRGEGLGERLAHAFADTARPGLATLLIGMDTPQLSAAQLADAGREIVAGETDAVLGRAHDGGWWCLGLREPTHAAVLRSVPMSTPHTWTDTLAALRADGRTVASLPVMRDVDTATDAYEVSRECPVDSRFADAVRRHLPRAPRTVR